MRAQFPWARASCLSRLQQALKRCACAAARLAASTRRLAGIPGANRRTGIAALLRDSKVQLGTITITLSGGEPQFGLVQAKTDENGHYEISGLPPGSYV